MVRQNPRQVTAPEEALEFETSKEVHVVTSFAEMGIKDDLLRGIYQYGFEKPSAIRQRAVVPNWVLCKYLIFGVCDFICDVGFDSCCEELLVLVVSNWVLCKDLIFGVCDFICDVGFDSCCEELLVLVVSNWVLCKDFIFGVCDFICDVGFVYWIFFLMF